DELPTPLRHLSWHEDTWGPFWNFVMALVACYGPALLLLMSYGANSLPKPVVLSLGGVMAIIGTTLFPAALLTTTTSGTLLNLRPDRVVGVTVVCGAEYLLVLITGLAG